RLNALLRTPFPRALVGIRSDNLVALIPFHQESKNPLNQVKGVGEKLCQGAAEWIPGLTLSIGYSGLIEAPGGVATAYREVRAVLNTMARFKLTDQIVAVSEMGLTSLLAGVGDERLREFVNRYLTALLKYDQAKQGKLLETLEVYLASGEQRSAAAKLNIHPNTLRYRLDRIREISGFELEEPEIRLNLALALRVNTLVNVSE
ncbi:MAG: PucR family transcriptional regulator, partial [Candidatus Dormibacteraceae bacterium]